MLINVLQLVYTVQNFTSSFNLPGFDLGTDCSAIGRPRHCHVAQLHQNGNTLSRRPSRVLTIIYVLGFKLWTLYSKPLFPKIHRAPNTIGNPGCQLFIYFQIHTLQKGNNYTFGSYIESSSLNLGPQQDFLTFADHESGNIVPYANYVLYVRQGQISCWTLLQWLLCWKQINA